MSLLIPDKKFFCFEEITPEILKRENVKLLICDLDNTIRVRKSKKPEQVLKDWVKKCEKAGTKIVVLSNNGKKKMIQKFCKPMDLSCVWWAHKPFTTKLKRLMEENKMSKKETVMLGDKLSTDVLAAKFAGIRAWKVEHRKKLYGKKD